MTIVTTPPGALDRDGAATYLAVSVSTLEELTRKDSTFPKPRQLSGRRTGWLLRELAEWLEKRPVSELPPPPNTGAPKPRAKRSTLPQPAPQAEPTAV